MKRQGQLDDTEFDFIDGLLARGYTWERVVYPYVRDLGIGYRMVPS
jgi:hypothetical protein